MSSHLPRNFHRAINSDPSNCFLLVGAGASAGPVRLRDQGLPTWSDLARAMLAELRDSRRGDSSLYREMETAIADGDLLRVADEFRRRSLPDQFLSFMRELLDPPDLTKSALHETILKVGFRGILTTNFDTVFEFHANSLTPLIFPQCLDTPQRFQRRGFFGKIHGCARNASHPEDLILSTDDYTRLRNDVRYQQLLHALLVASTVLTVGFSLTDPDFIGLLEDLRQTFGKNTPTIYALMKDPGAPAREAWLARGVDIIPYSEHLEAQLLLQSLADWSTPVHVAGDASGMDFAPLLVEWSKQYSVEERNDLISELLARARSDHQRECLLLRAFALLGRENGLPLLSNLLALDTPTSTQVVGAMLLDAAKVGNLYNISPHASYIDLRSLILSKWREIDPDRLVGFFHWAFRGEWSKCGANLSASLDSVIADAIEQERPDGLLRLYQSSWDTKVLQERIEAVALSDSFQTGATPGSAIAARRRAAAAIQLLRIRSQLHSEARVGDAEESWSVIVRTLEDSGALATFDDDSPLYLIADEFVRRVHMGLHSSSSLYDPSAAERIRDALAQVSDKDSQVRVLLALQRWHLARRGLGSVGEDQKSLTEGLFVPLWWSYSTDARIRLVGDRGRMSPEVLNIEVGQDYLVRKLMGLEYDPDREFRAEFDRNLEQYRVDSRWTIYEPRLLQELWRDRELTFEYVRDEAPPELVRRAATQRTDWEQLSDAKSRWAETSERVRDQIAHGDIDHLVSENARTWAIDGILASYDGRSHRVRVFGNIISLASRLLSLPEASLDSLAFAYGSVRAYLHLATDRDGRKWPLAGTASAELIPEGRIIRPVEAFAQYYTRQLALHLRLSRLLHAFERVSECGSDDANLWRTTEDWTLESARRDLLRFREAETQWIPMRRGHEPSEP